MLETRDNWRFSESIKAQSTIYQQSGRLKPVTNPRLTSSTKLASQRVISLYSIMKDSNLLSVPPLTEIVNYCMHKYILNLYVFQFRASLYNLACKVRAIVRTLTMIPDLRNSSRRPLLLV